MDEGFDGERDSSKGLIGPVLPMGGRSEGDATTTLKR